MEPISTGSDARFNFQVGKMKISEGIKCLQDLIEGCKKNLSPENVGILHETMTYLQSLQGQIKVIESSARQGDAFGSNPHVNEQEITQRREQNTNFGSTLNQEIDVVTNKKRKTWSKVWNHFTKYKNKDKEVKARCQYCNKDFDGSSKKGTTHLRNHLESCLKNQNRVADKMKELSVVDQELNHSNLGRKVIKYGWNNLKDDINKVYKEEENKLHRYLDKLSGRFNVIIDFNVIIEDDIWGSGVELVKIWFIDDEWKLKTRIIHLKNYEAYENLSKEHFLKCLIQNWNIDKRILSIVNHREDSFEDLVPQITNWLNEGVSLPVIGNYKTDHRLLSDFEIEVGHVALKGSFMSKVGELQDYCVTSSNKNKLDLAVKQVESMGKKVTSKYNDGYLYHFELLDWAMGYKEVFCELKRIDPDFPSSNFDWDDATSLQSFWVVVQDIKNDIRKLGDSKLANERFPMVYHLFSKILQFKNTENQYFGLAALRCREVFDEHCNNIVTVIPVILDPRFKLGIVKDFYNEVYDNEEDFKKIMDDVTNIYNKYATDVNNSSMVIANANEAASSKSEFERYLTADKVPPPHEGFDILEWWRVNSPTYPALAMMARDFLSIPIVNSPYVFFEDGVDDIYDMDFDVGLKDVLACTKDWLKDHDCM